MKKILLAILGVVLILVAVIVIKTLTFKSNQPSIAAVDTIKVDENAVIARLSQALKIQTLSSNLCIDPMAYAALQPRVMPLLETHSNVSYPICG